MSLEELQAGRCVAHVDLDAFYVQVEVKRHPSIRGKPSGVVQYNPNGDLSTVPPEADRVFNNSNGSLIAVSYEARAKGVKRGMRGDEARKACREVHLVQVPVKHGKADLTLYRAAGKQVADILARLAVAERASIDECYLDITEEARRRMAACAGHPPPPVRPEQVHVSGQEGQAGMEAWWARPAEKWGPGERLLACGAAAVADLRAAVWEELGYSCSAGIAHNKILAKLASGLHKPAQQTVVTLAAVPSLMQGLPIPKLRQLGGKFGADVMAALNISTVGELAAVPLARLEGVCGEADAQWLQRLSRGIDDEEVKERQLPKSLSCGKTFRGHTALRDLPTVHKWLLELGAELEERIAADRAANARIPRLLTVGMWGEGGPGTSGGGVSRSCPLQRPDAPAMAADALKLIKRWAAEQPGWAVTSLYITAANFVAAPTGASTITRFLTRPRRASPPAAAPSTSSSGPPASALSLERHMQQAASEPLSGSSEAALPVHGGLCWPEQEAAQALGQAGARSGEEAHMQSGVCLEGAAAKGAAREQSVHAEDALPCSLADWLEPSQLHTSGAPAPAAKGLGFAGGDSSNSDLANGNCDGSGVPAPQQRGSPESAAAPAEAPAPAPEPGLAGTSGRGHASAASAEGNRNGEASCIGRGAGGEDAPLLVHFADKDVDPEVLAALPVDIRRELQRAMQQRSLRKGQAVTGAKQAGARQLPKAPAKRPRKSNSGNAQITNFYGRAKPP